MEAWHFLKADFTAGYGLEPAWAVGETRTIPKPKRIKLCDYGYHSAPTAFDALANAPGPICCLVEVSEPVDRSDSYPRKQVSATRTLLSAHDVTRELRLFAADCAERALQRERSLGHEPDSSSWLAVEIARRYANGRASEGDLDAARSAAESAAESAARYAAESAEQQWQRERLTWYLDPLFAETSGEGHD